MIWDRLLPDAYAAHVALDLDTVEPGSGRVVAILSKPGWGRVARNLVVND